MRMLAAVGGLGSLVHDNGRSLVRHDGRGCDLRAIKAQEVDSVC